MAAEWAALADVPRHRVPGIAKVLRAHGICLPDGTVDPLAEKFVENHQGTLRIIEGAEGSMFRLELPMDAEAVVERSSRRAV